MGVNTTVASCRAWVKQQLFTAATKSSAAVLWTGQKALETVKRVVEPWKLGQIPTKIRAMEAAEKTVAVAGTAAVFSGLWGLYSAVTCGLPILGAMGSCMAVGAITSFIGLAVSPRPLNEDNLKPVLVQAAFAAVPCVAYAVYKGLDPITFANHAMSVLAGIAVTRVALDVN